MIHEKFSDRYKSSWICVLMKSRDRKVKEIEKSFICLKSSGFNIAVILLVSGLLKTGDWLILLIDSGTL